MTASRLTSIELFSGAGGLALGTTAAGFDHRLLLEYNRDACRTLAANRKVFGERCHIHEGDVRQFSFRDFRDVDLLAAGAPCQPFSNGGKHRADGDERNLFPQVFRAVREVRPRAIIIENVKGLLRTSLSDFVEYIELQLSLPEVVPMESRNPSEWPAHLDTLRRMSRRSGDSDFSYRVQRLLVNAADFGVPQVRQRVFFVALRNDVATEWTPPRRTHSEAALRLAQEVSGSYWERHNVNRRFRPSHPQAGKWLREAGVTQPWRTVRDALQGLPEPIPGASFSEWSNHVGQAGARSYPGHSGSPLDRPAKTLKAGVHGVPGGENMLRRLNGTVRYFTVREAARLQTFPDQYVVSGAWGEAMRQIGNAVPVLLAQVVARSVAECLLRATVEPQRRPLQSRPSVQQVEIPQLLIASA